MGPWKLCNSNRRIKRRTKWERKKKRNCTYMNVKM